MLNGFEEDINYILDSTNAVEVARDGKLGELSYSNLLETKDENFAKGGVAEGYFQNLELYFMNIVEKQKKKSLIIILMLTIITMMQ